MKTFYLSGSPLAAASFLMIAEGERAVRPLGQASSLLKKCLAQCTEPMELELGRFKRAKLP